MPAGIRRAVKFMMQFRGDGSATEFEFLLSTAPLWWDPSPLAGQVPEDGFSLTALAPSDVVDVVCPPGPTVASAELTTLKTKLKVVFGSAPAADVTHYLLGTLLF